MLDICSNNHHYNPESVAAFTALEPKISLLHNRIIFALSGRQMTCKELEFVIGLSHQTASARVSELKKMGKVVKTGERRDGSAVLMVSE